MIEQVANPIFIICSDDLEESVGRIADVLPVKLSSVVSDDVLSIQVYGLVVSSARDRLVAEKLVLERNLNVEILELTDQQSPETAVIHILAGQIGRGEISRSELMREMISLESEVERLEHRIQEIQRFMETAAIDDSITVFSSLRTQPEARLVLGHGGLSVGSIKISVNTAFYCRLPVPLSRISCIHFENVLGDLGAGWVKFSLNRLADQQPIVSWTIRGEDWRPDHSIMLYVPDSDAGDLIDVALQVMAENFGPEDHVSFPLGPPKADDTSHIYYGDVKGIKHPLCLAISRGLPFQRSTPFTGCIYPDAFGGHLDYNLKKSTLYSAEQAWPKKQFPHDLVGEKTYQSTGLLIHPIVNDTTCAHIALNGELPRKSDKIIIHTINDSDRNNGILFTAFISREKLQGRALKKRIGQLDDWMMVAPGSKAAFSISTNYGGDHLYLLSAVEKGATNQYCWFLVDNIKFVSK